MKCKSIYYILIFTCLSIILSACGVKDTNVSKESFVRIIDSHELSGGDSQFYSYYYNINKASSVEIKLDIYREGRVIVSEHISKEKKVNTNGKVTGTVGLSIKEDVDNIDKLLWTIRNDEEVRTVTSDNFIKSMLVKDSQLTHEGMLVDRSTVPLVQSFYSMKDVERTNENIVGEVKYNSDGSATAQLKEDLQFEDIAEEYDYAVLISLVIKD